MKCYKNILLLSALILFSGPVMAYGATGHARQQLRLIALEAIAPAMDDAIMALNLPDLPLTVLDGEHPTLSRQLDVLVAEGMLNRESVVAYQRELTANGWVQRNTSGQRYESSPETIDQPVMFGHSRLTRVGEVMIDPQSDGQTSARIHFSWQATELAEWVWASAFDQDDRLNRIKASLNEPIQGEAILQWQSNQWVLEGLRAFAEP